LCKL